MTVTVMVAFTLRNLSNGHLALEKVELLSENTFLF